MNLSGKTPLIILLGGLLSIFLLVQWKYGILQVPFFWDELGVYSRAAIHQAIHGVSLLPGSTPDVLSRGHPLLSTAYFATLLKIFGINLPVARSAAYIIYSATVILSFIWLRLRTTTHQALIITFILALQPIFLAQGFLVLPEQLLLFFTLLSLFFYDKDNLLMLVITLSAAIMVKESALVLPIAFGLAYFFRKAQLIKTGLVTIIPVAVFILFLIIQKAVLSYYLYPLHTSLIDLNPMVVLNKLIRALNFVFIQQGRVFITLILCLCLIFYGKTFQLKTWLSDAVFWLGLGGLLFAAVNYYLERYTQYWLWPLAAVALVFIVTKTPTKWRILVYSLGLVIPLFFMNPNKKFEDTSFAYISHTQCIEKTIVKMNEMAKGKNVAYNWPYIMANWTEFSGYSKANHKILDVSKNKEDSIDYVVLSAIGQPQFNNAPEWLTKLNYAEIERFNHHYEYVRIYKKLNSKSSTN